MKKLSKSEAGKLGAEKSRITSVAKKKARINEYNKNPTLCAQCENPLAYEKRSNKFCDKSCSAQYNNIVRARKDSNRTVTCKYCSKEFLVKQSLVETRKFCSQQCQIDLLKKQKLHDWLVEGKSIGKGSMKRYVLTEQDNKCNHCGLTDWNGKPIVLELEHKDGNSENNARDNLECICPNCHSQTDTFKGRNAGNGRHTRRVRYAAGKSY